jgi:hypothetical protein
MLNALVESEINEIDGVVEESIGFKVTDLDSANRCFRKISALNEKIKENQDLASKEKQRIELWEKKENETAKQSIEYFESVLKEYYVKLREQDPKAKVSTPYGKITSRKAPKWNYTDETSLLQYLQDNDTSLIRIKEEINKADLKKKYKDGINTETGEILPGVEISDEESISIKTE